MKVFSVAVIAAAFLSCAKPAPVASTTTVNAEVIEVRRAPVTTLHEVAGTVRAETTSTLAANVVGTVVRVNVAEGDRVRKGDVLVEIDARDLRANADRARAGGNEIERAIDAANANARLAQATYARIAALSERGSASRQEFDEAVSRRDAAQAELARLTARRGEVRAASAQAEAVLGYASVRAPIDGVVTARHIDPGAQAAPGVPLLAIENATAVRVDAHVPEHVTVRAADKAWVDGAEARVVRVQPSVDPASRATLVQLEVSRPLRAGSYVKVAFAAGARDAITVPNEAIVRHGQLTSVFVVGTGDVARMRLITLGARGEVLSGLDAGERIVIAPGKVKDGVVVRSNA